MKRLLFTFLCIAVAIGTGYGNKVTIVVSDFQFAPDLVNLQLGDTVVFQWSNGLHTATSSEIPDGAATFDATLSAEMDEFVYVPMVIGTYNYVCTPHMAMGMDGSFVVEAPTGISDQYTKAMDLRVWPNPVSEILNVFVEGNSHLEGVIEVYNMAGQRLYSVKLSTTGNGVAQIVVGHLPVGIYAARLATGQSVATRLFVRRP